MTTIFPRQGHYALDETLVASVPPPDLTIERIGDLLDVDFGASGLSTLIKDHLAGGASRLAALLLPQILPVFSVVAPCQPGAALRDLVLVQRGQATSGLSSSFVANLTRTGDQQPRWTAAAPAAATRISTSPG